MEHKIKFNEDGLGIGTILFLIFLVLKLTNFIDWSWWWITAPLWIPIVVVVGIIGVIGIITIIKNKK